MEKRLIVVGGGAAGFFCAVNAARLNPALQVIIIEKSKKLLSKVKISGGGRCNVTHACFDMDEMSRQYPRGKYFVRKALHRFSTKDTIKWFEDRGVNLKTENDGRMFPVSDSSQTIIDCLIREANKNRVEILLNREVKRINLLASGFNVQFAEYEDMYADFVCIASGGYPKMEMFNWLKELGHTIEEPVPSLFTFNMPGNSITTLMGISLEKAGVKIIGTKLYEEGPLLITHWGMSGPAILRLSAWGARELSVMNYQFRILVNWVPEFHENSLRERFSELRNQYASQKIITRNIFKLPGRLWEFLARESGVSDDLRWADLPASAQNRFIKNLCSYECDVKGKTTFKEEFVTAGGIKLSETDPDTMMSKKVPNLFFAGEVLDVDGITGGYNFQHAWTSGWIAADSIAKYG